MSFNCGTMAYGTLSLTWFYLQAFMFFNSGTTGLRDAYHWHFSEFRLVPIKHSLSGALLLSYNPLEFFDYGTAGPGNYIP